MSWQTVYLDTGTKANAQLLFSGLGFVPPTALFTMNSDHCVFLNYSVIGGLDDAAYGYPVLVRCNTDLASGQSALTTILGSPHVKTPSFPSNVWA
jgi:hypothetical protein